jgi:copper chaperone CopZ
MVRPDRYIPLRGIYVCNVESARMIITHCPVTPVLMYGHCEASVRDEVSAVVGVDTVALSAAAGAFTVTSTAELVQAQIIVARDAGYTAEPEPASSWDA